MGLELLDMARAVAAFDLPGKSIAWLRQRNTSLSLSRFRKTPHLTRQVSYASTLAASCGRSADRKPLVGFRRADAFRPAIVFFLKASNALPAAFDVSERRNHG